MMGFIIVAIIVFALIQKHRYRRMCAQNKYDKWSRKWDRHMARNDKWDKWSRDWEDWGKSEWKEIKAWSRGQDWRRVGEDWKKVGKDVEKAAFEFQSRLKDKIERETQKMREKADQQRPEEPKFKSDDERRAYERARKRASQEAGFYVHLMWYGIVIGFLFFINLLTTPYPWFLWPALGWGFGLVSHFAAVYGWDVIRQRVFDPAIAREVQREVTKEKEVMATEKQASLDELTASFAHEIRNPIAAAKSLVQQMGEDPTSQENVEYAKVALDELQRVERSVSHLLKYAKEEDYNFDNVNLASVLDAALTQMRSKLETKKVSVSRNYIGGPTIRADADKLRQVFTNVIDNAIDAMENNAGERHLDLAIRSGVPGMATVAVRDNGCGIPEDKLSKIFNPFYTTKQSGTGLGMGIAKKVVDSHRGRIDVLSKVGEGTEFLISIPLADAARVWNQAELNGAAPSVDGTAVAANGSAPQPMPHATTTLNDGAPTAKLAAADSMRSRQ
jgi:signal transduction histidine kinase